MGKLYKRYLECKSTEDKDSLFIFKSGIFYIFLDEDAKLVSEKLGLKLTNLNNSVLKCGFPVSKLTKYTNLLKEYNFKFTIIDEELNKVNAIDDYLSNTNILSNIDKIKKLDISKISPVQAFNILYDFKSIL